MRALSMLSFVLILFGGYAEGFAQSGFNDMNIPFPDPPPVVEKRDKSQRVVSDRSRQRISGGGSRDVIPLVEPTAYVAGVRSAKYSPAGWTTGNAQIDSFIRESGGRNRVDPYLIFCLMNQESGFKAGAVSPKGARGLMQLMPGTAARFGVRNIFDARENIEGGTKYLRYLLDMFGDTRLDLVLAGYNAGEQAVIKYSMQVPPYQETINYVRIISSRYGTFVHRAGVVASD